MNRQTERRQRFQSLLATMPNWEIERRAAPTASNPNAVEVINAKQIPRRVRRDMARQRANREFRVARGLSEPRS